jgi:2'-5' RNA ligase
MRTFIAINLPEDIKRVVGEYVDALQGVIPDIKWVTPENTHLTVKFLGDVPDERIGMISECVAGAAAGFNPFDIELAHMGFFPNSHQPRVVWIGADGGADHLLELFQTLEDCLETVGVDREEKTFSPHLTIGRVKRHERLILPSGIPEFEEVTFQVNGMSLIKSTLTPQGPIYETLSDAAFQQFSLQEP